MLIQKIAENGTESKEDAGGEGEKQDFGFLRLNTTSGPAYSMEKYFQWYSISWYFISLYFISWHFYKLAFYKLVFYKLVFYNLIFHKLVFYSIVL